MIRRLHKNEEIPYALLLLADETTEAINKYVGRADIYVYERDNVVIGVYVLQEISDDTVEIKNISVDKKHQGQGIGTLLLRDASDKAKMRGFKKIVIGTGDAAIRQLYLYQKVGFEVFAIKENFFIDNYPEPIYENGVQLKHMIMLKKDVT